MRFIGDTHGKFKKYAAIASECDASIQVGDYGAGFKPIPDLGPGHRFIRGNHDNPAVCREHPNWIPDGTIEGRMFLIGGGYSIDRATRTEGVDWWHDEELTIGEFYQSMDAYEDSDCDIIVSHECPHDVAPLLFSRRRKRINNPSRTSQALSSFLWIRRPKIWIFGHWHINVDQEIEGTRFICLSELKHIDINL